MSEYTTEFGSLDNVRAGGVTIINDDPRNYVFSNLFEVARDSAPYERVAVGKNFEYVIESARAEGESPWFIARHDEFALCMDGRVEVNLVKPEDADAMTPSADGAHILDSVPAGRKMGRIQISRGHMALLPAGAAYRFRAEAVSVLAFQTIQGPATVEKWAEICQTGPDPIDSGSA